MKAMLDNKGAVSYNEPSEWERYSRTDREVKECSEFAVKIYRVGVSAHLHPLRVGDNRPLSTTLRRPHLTS